MPALLLTCFVILGDDPRDSRECSPLLKGMDKAGWGRGREAEPWAALELGWSFGVVANPDKEALPLFCSHWI